MPASTVQSNSTLPHLVRRIVVVLMVPLVAMVAGGIAHETATGRGAAANAAAGAFVPPADRCVILVSLDGFANFYLNEPRADIPILKKLIAAGAVAEGGMECSFPTVTWPNHTTLVTGVPPARHGVLGNNVFDRVAGEPLQLLVDPVLDKDEIVRVPTIYDVAKKAGLKTAGVIWPATRNAKTLDWCIPDMMKQEEVEKFSTPGWLDSLKAKGIPYDRYAEWVKVEEGGPRRDWMATRAVVSLIEERRANLILLHLIELDHTQHRFGPKSGDALWAVSTMNDRIDDIKDVIEHAGLLDKTTLLVTSDHGFFAIDHSIHVNVALRELGLVKVEDKKVTSKVAWGVSQGGGAAVYILDREHRAEIAKKIVAAMRQVEGVEAVIEPKDFAKIGQATPDEDKFGADLWLAAKEGYTFSNDALGEHVVAESKPGGTHGYLPTHAGMHGIFFAWGRGIKPGTKLGTIKNTQVAATIAMLLDLEMPTAEGKPLIAMLDGDSK